MAVGGHTCEKVVSLENLWYCVILVEREECHLAAPLWHSKHAVKDSGGCPSFLTKVLILHADVGKRCSTTMQCLQNPLGQAWSYRFEVFWKEIWIAMEIKITKWSIVQVVPLQWGPVMRDRELGDTCWEIDIRSHVFWAASTPCSQHHASLRLWVAIGTPGLHETSRFQTCICGLLMLTW